MNKFLNTLLFKIITLTIMAQNDPPVKKEICKFPLVVSAEFQNFSLPLHDVASHFTHPGISIGTETNLNRKSTLIQQLNAAFVINKEMGSSFYIYTQTAYRFRIYRPLFGEFKFGAGWQRNFHPADAYEYKNGNWKSIEGGKSIVIVPVGVSLFYKQNKEEKLIPFISFQAIPSLFYNETLPLSFYNIFQAGVKIYFKSNSKK